MENLVGGSFYKVFTGELKAGDALYAHIHQLKQLQDQNTRCKVMLNDGKYQINGVIKTSFKGPISKFCVFRVSDYTLQKLNGRLYIVINGGDSIAQGTEPVNTNMISLTKYFDEHPNELKLTLAPNDIFIQETGVKKQEVQAAAPVSVTTPAAASVTAPNPNKFPNLISIDQLSPYQSTWSIKARVSQKSDLREWSNQRGKGKLFSVNLLDETGEIKATGFNQTADKFYDLFKENKVYYITKAAITQAKKQYSTLSNDHEIHLDRDTIVEEVLNDTSVPKVQFHLMKFDQLQNTENNTIVDVVGIVKSVGEPREIVAKSSGKPYTRRDISLVDDTGFEATVGLWNKLAKDFQIDEGTVVAIKGCKINDFGGKQLSLIPSAVLMANPDLPEAYQLKGWFDNNGSNSTFKSVKSIGGGAGQSRDLNSLESIKQRESISSIESKGLGPDGQAYYNLKANVSYVRTENTFCYPACASEGCSKKVIQQPDGQWRCETCSLNHDQPIWRYILTVSALDSTGQIWLNLFNDQAETLIGKSAGELKELKDMDESGLKSYLDKNVLYKEYSFRIRAKLDSYNGVDRTRYQVLGLAPIDYSLEASALVEEFNSVNL